MSTTGEETAYFFSDAATAERQRVRDARRDAANILDFGADWSSYETADFTGAAVLELTLEDLEKLEDLASKGWVDYYIVSNILQSNLLALDMLITDVDFTIGEHHKLEEHIGDTYALDFFGKAPIIINAKAQLIDLDGNNSKYKLMLLYTQLFRLSKVIRWQIVPQLRFVGCNCSVAFLELGITESMTQADTLQINMSLLALDITYFNSANVSGNYEVTMSDVPATPVPEETK